MNVKRKPKRRSGALLFALHERIIALHDKYVATTSEQFERSIQIEKLNKRIQGYLEREDKKAMEQAAMFGTFKIKFIKPGNIRPTSKVVTSTNAKAAKDLIKKRYGRCKTLECIPHTPQKIKRKKPK